ncbi:hypothetical protein MD484_g6616, partial [Candolleomyces efflorescens]
MLGLLSLLSLCRLVLGAPALPPSCPFSFDIPDPAGGIHYVTNYRSTPQIIWTCLVTTCLCTWVSMHPDILGYNYSGKDRIRRRVLMFLVAFVAPEVTLLFAAAQWKIAHDIIRKLDHRMLPETRAKNFVMKILSNGTQKEGHNCLGIHDVHDTNWRLMHGHFLLMGGVLFFDKGSPEYLELGKLLGDDAVKDRDEKQKYKRARLALKRDLPSWPRDIDIRDRSKADAITKGVTFLQTIWFIVHLAIRRVQHLNVTALEVITLAYALTTIFVYLFWKDKPLHVQNPIVISLDPLRPYEPPASKDFPPIGHDGSYLGSFILMKNVVNAILHTLRIRSSVPEAKEANDVHPPKPKPYLSMGSVGYAFVPLALVILGVPGSFYYIAWNFTFPNYPLGQHLWRVSCIVGTSIPIVFTGSALLLATLGTFAVLVLGPIPIIRGKLRNWRRSIPGAQSNPPATANPEQECPTPGDSDRQASANQDQERPQTRFHALVASALMMKAQEREQKREQEQYRKTHWAKKVGYVVLLVAFGPVLLLLGRLAECRHKLRNRGRKPQDGSPLQRFRTIARKVIAREQVVKVRRRVKVWEEQEQERVEQEQKQKRVEQEQKPEVAQEQASAQEHWLEKVARVLVSVFLFACFWVCYFGARLVLVSIALWSLYDLPADAHRTVAWARFIPHF